ncbi:hypothetical protein BH23GEM6_BH23GEM6_12520 [soil metagenome]
MSIAKLSEALRLLLGEIPSRFPPEQMDRIWIFAPREIGSRESGLVVLSLLNGSGDRPEQRRLVTWHYEAVRDRGGWKRKDAVTEQGRAPHDRIPGMMAGVLARLGDATEAPLEHSIGDRDRWSALMTSLGVNPVDPPRGE